ncbi:MAG TPA: hypothetical protein VKU92_00700 [Acidimicrobiales bacterium]|nr:hypothetical protein [Acidimicrobiales bacterium]
MQGQAMKFVGDEPTGHDGAAREQKAPKRRRQPLVGKGPGGAGAEIVAFPSPRARPWRAGSGRSLLGLFRRARRQPAAEAGRERAAADRLHIYRPDDERPVRAGE